MLLIATIALNNPEEVIKTCDSAKGIIGTANIVFDGGSMKSVIDIYDINEINYFSKLDSGIYYGMNNAINFFLKNSTFTHLMFLNSGDVLERRNSTAISNLDKGISYSFLVRSNKEFFSNLGKRDLQRIPYPHPGLILSRIHLKTLGYFNTQYKSASDLDLMNRICFSIKKKALVLVNMAPPGSSSSYLSRIESFTIAIKHGKNTFSALLTLFKDILYKFLCN